MSRRFYVTQFGFYWSWSEKGSLKLLQDGAADTGWGLDSPEYEVREIKKLPVDSLAINVTNFQSEHYKEELEYFLRTGEQTGFNVPNDARKFNK